MNTDRVCKCCGRLLTQADQARDVFGFQRWNDHPEFPAVALFNCTCTATYGFEVPQPRIQFEEEAIGA
ncbi:MAG TPA: hypothetical protein VGP93_07400 [Polyangiaceae bacterium]|nr:hypothetical protein [Polyangiaceae bacterium]